MTIKNFPEYFKTCLLILKMACSCQNRYAYTYAYRYISINLLNKSIVIAFRFRPCLHLLLVKGEQPGRASLPLQGCLNVAVTSNKNNNRLNQKKRRRTTTRMKMTLVLMSLPVTMRTVGWVSQVFLRLVFLGLLSPHQGTTTIFHVLLLVQFQERQLPGEHQRFQELAEACRVGVNSSGSMRFSHCWKPFLLTCQLGPMNGKLLHHSTTRISQTKNGQDLHFAESFHNCTKLRNQLGTQHALLR